MVSPALEESIALCRVAKLPGPLRLLFTVRTVAKERFEKKKKESRSAENEIKVFIKNKKRRLEKWSQEFCQEIGVISRPQMKQIQNQFAKIYSVHFKDFMVSFPSVLR